VRNSCGALARPRPSMQARPSRSTRSLLLVPLAHAIGWAATLAFLVAVSLPFTPAADAGPDDGAAFFWMLSPLALCVGPMIACAYLFLPLVLSLSMCGLLSRDPRSARVWLHSAMPTSALLVGLGSAADGLDFDLALGIGVMAGTLYGIMCLCWRTAFGADGARPPS
jgi:hypothetical protein